MQTHSEPFRADPFSGMVRQPRGNPPLESMPPPNKPSGDSAREPAARSAAESPLHLVLRVTSMLIGWPIFTVAIAAWLGLLIESPWIALGVAAAITVLPTLLLADRLLPEDDPRKGGGIATDAISLVWLSGAVLVMGPLAFLLHDPLVSWAERAAGPGVAVTIADFLTGEPEASRDERETPTATTAADDDAGAPDGGVEDGGTPAVEPDDASVTTDDAFAEDDAAEAPDAGTDAGSATAEMSPADVFRTYASAVVSIEVMRVAGGARGERAGGTGFVVDRRGVVATNHHVIANASSVRVKLLDGSFADSVELLVDDEPHDLALLEIRTAHELRPVRLGDSDAVEVGERAVVIGNPLGLEHTLSDGIVSARRRIEDHNMIQMTAPVSPGNSGGPVFDDHGEVIGVTTAVIGLGLGQNLNLAVPVNVLRTLIRDEYPDRRAFGAEAASSRGGHW